MPTYVYEAKELGKGCAKCRGGFEVVQSLKDERLTACPDCGAEIYRVSPGAWMTHSKTDLHYRAKRAGFKCLKKVQKGEYETIY